MPEGSIAITYETLYEILRAEKNKEELCELDDSFYQNILEYLCEKTRILAEASAKNNIFSTDEKNNTHIQLQNIRKIIKEIYERREKKIIDMALNKSRTNSNIIDTTNLLAPEQKFFETIRDLLDKFRTGLLAQILALNKPSLEIECIIKQPKTPEQPEPISPMPEEKEEREEQTQEPQKNTKKIKMTKQVEQFVGKELELYGPYNTEETIELPIEIAQILIEKQSAIEEK